MAMQDKDVTTPHNLQGKHWHWSCQSIQWSLKMMKVYWCSTSCPVQRNHVYEFFQLMKKEGDFKFSRVNWAAAEFYCSALSQTSPFLFPPVPLPSPAEPACSQLQCLVCSLPTVAKGHTFAFWPQIISAFTQESLNHFHCFPLKIQDSSETFFNGLAYKALHNYFFQVLSLKSIKFMSMT